MEKVKAVLGVDYLGSLEEGLLAWGMVRGVRDSDLWEAEHKVTGERRWFLAPEGLPLPRMHRDSVWVLSRVLIEGGCA